MSTSPDIEASMAGLTLSDRQGAPSGTDPAAVSSNQDETATGCIAAGSEASGPLETMIATALQGVNVYKRRFKLPSNSFDLIERVYKDQGQPHIFDAEWLDIGLKSQIDNSGNLYLASHVSLPETTVAAIYDALYERVGAAAPETLNVKQILTLAPVIRNETNSADIPAPYEEDKNSLCIHIGSTGLSGRCKEWETKRERLIDVFDGNGLRLRPSGDSWVGLTEIERFQQRERATIRWTTNEKGKTQGASIWLRPKPFSAWYGTDTQDARQRALDNKDSPDIKVGFQARLYTLSTPIKQADTELDSKTDATASTSSDN